MAAVGWNGSARLSSLAKPTKSVDWTMDRAFSPPAFSPDGGWLAVASDVWYLYKLSTSEQPVLAMSNRDCPTTTSSVAFSDDGLWLAVGCQDNATVLLYNVGVDPGHPKLAATLIIPEQEPLCLGECWDTRVAFSSDGKWLATGSCDSFVRLFSLANPESPVISAVLGDPGCFSGYGAVWTLTFSSDGAWLAVGSCDKSVRLYSLADPGKPTLSATMSDSTGYINHVAFSRDGAWLATTSWDKMVRLYSLNGTAPVLSVTLCNPTYGAKGVFFSKDDVWLVTGSDDLWFDSVGKVRYYKFSPEVLV